MRRFSSLLLGLLGLPLAHPALAHDFWLQPQSYATAPGASVPITVQVGHGEANERWAGLSDRIVVMTSTGPKGRIDRRPEFQLGQKVDGAALAFATPGVHVLAFQSTLAESNLPGLRFNDYAKAEGLTPALDYRQKVKAMERPGREVYSRRAKALIQVGSPGAAPQPQVTRPVGLSLEIVPELNPYLLAPNQDLPVRVLFEGRPLAGALVKLTNLEFDGRPLETQLTDKSGRATFRIPKSGSWLINVIWTKPIKGNPRADFETTFSSLTFGYPRRRASLF